MIAERELAQTPETVICPACYGTCKAPFGDPFAEPGEPIYDDCDRCKGTGRVKSTPQRPALTGPPEGTILNPRKYTDVFGGITFQAGATGLTLRVGTTGEVEVYVDEMYGEGESDPIICATVTLDELQAAMMDRCFANMEYTARMEADEDEMWTRLQISAHYDDPDPLDGCDPPEAYGLRPC